MPKTATDLPLLGSIGVVLLALGAGFAFLRRRGRA
jgi:LPXTG-motif cell wall-anchored protein